MKNILVLIFLLLFIGCKQIADKPIQNQVNLEDYKGKIVTLEGKLWSSNRHWWFEYDSEQLYLTDQNGTLLTFCSDNHASKAIVVGQLVQQLRPSLKQIGYRSDRDLVPTYVVRNAKIKYLDPKTWRQRLSPVYAKNPISDGVPELLAEKSKRMNYLGNETSEKLYAERNYDAIISIVSKATPPVRNVITKRMLDPTLNESIRLLYATILARVNDTRGQAYLLNAFSTIGNSDIKGLLYCLGEFPFLASDEYRVKTNCSWVAQILIEIMTDPEMGKKASRVSSIPSVMILIDTPATRKALLNYALKNANSPYSDFFTGPAVLSLLCMPMAHLPAEDLLRLEAVNEEQYDRRKILVALLRLKEPLIAERFLKDFEDGFVYMDVRDNSSPEILAALKPLLNHLSGNAKSKVQMLLILGEKEPLPKIITLLDDNTFTDKNLVMYELKRIGDHRMVLPIAKILRDTPKEYFGDDDPSSGIKNALEALSIVHSRAAVQELISLLSVDLGRFGGYIKQDGLQRIVAAHLIEMTGESFGIDQASWQAWEKAQPDKRFQIIKSVNNSNKMRIGPDSRVDMNR